MKTTKLFTLSLMLLQSVNAAVTPSADPERLAVDLTDKRITLAHSPHAVLKDLADSEKEVSFPGLQVTVKVKPTSVLVGRVIDSAKSARSTFMNIREFQNRSRDDKKMFIESYSAVISFIPEYQRGLILDILHQD